MENKCPICGNLSSLEQAICDMCGYPHLDKSFASEAKRNEWECTVISSCNAIWKKVSADIITTKLKYRDALIRSNELLEQIEEMGEEIEELIDQRDELQNSFDNLVETNKDCSALCEDFAAMVEVISKREKELQKAHAELKEKYIELLLSR